MGTPAAQLGSADPQVEEGLPLPVTHCPADGLAS